MYSINTVMVTAGQRRRQRDLTGDCGDVSGDWDSGDVTGDHGDVSEDWDSGDVSDDWDSGDVSEDWDSGDVSGDCYDVSGYYIDVSVVRRCSL